MTDQQRADWMGCAGHPVLQTPHLDALAASGMQRFRDAFWAVWEPGHPDAEAGRSGLAYASLCSGITLAQAGLGSVHGLASPLGAFFPIPHGVVCGTLVASATSRSNCNPEISMTPKGPKRQRANGSIKKV